LIEIRPDFSPLQEGSKSGLILDPLQGDGGLLRFAEVGGECLPRFAEGIDGNG